MPPRSGSKRRAAKAPRKRAKGEPTLPAVNPAVEPHDIPEESLPFPVVGIGASAGGISALSEFFRALPADTGMAFVVIQHLDPHHQSLLAEIIGRDTRMPVAEAENHTEVEPNHVYVIPPGKTLLLGQGLLELAPRTELRGQHRPVDHFMRSQAEEMGFKGIGVILSGTGSDGTLGMEELKAGGGITFVQDDTAEQTSMPRSAVAAGVVDFVLPPDEIAREIGRISRHPAVRPPTEPAEFSPKDPQVMHVLQMLRNASGVDFSSYKYNTLQRRITRRMVLHKQEGLRDYVHLLEKHPGELDALYQDILISVTSFFRNEDAYEALKTRVFPQLTEARTRHESVRVWALGCSTGEEAYSIAMAFTEYLEETGKRHSLQVFATDLNGLGIEKARAAMYPRGIAQDVSPERLRRFFVEVDGSYRIAKPIRDMCVFARQNVLADPPFSRMDLIACRNMLIYLEPVLQQRLIPLMHYSLRPKGYLWLGSSETIGSYRDLFELEDVKHKIYARKGERAERVEIPLSKRDASNASAAERRDSALARLDPHREADRLALARYAPPGVMLDADQNILQFRGDVSAFIAPPAGRASLSLLKMLREGLMVAVRGALARARRTGETVREDGLRVRSGSAYRDVSVVVIPLKGAQPPGSVLVLFEEPLQSREARVAQYEEVASIEKAEKRHRSRDPDPRAREITQLRQELQATREYLQSVIEQQEAANEELQSANEEVQSSNEELQSINEELETSKEEIQSSNEELATVNEELQNRNLELSRSSNDLTNLVASVQMPIVMLGPDLRVRRFTPAAEKVLNLIAADIGRPIADLKLPVEVPDLEEMVTAAIDTMSLQEREVQDSHQHAHLLRVRPYRTLENRIDGAVVMLLDVEAVKRAERGQRESEARFATLADSAPVLIWVSGPEGIDFSNQACEEFFGVSESELRGYSWAQFVHPEDREAYVEALRAATARHEPFEAFCRMRREDGTYRWMKSVALPRVLSGRTAPGHVGCTFDITELKEAEQMHAELDRNKDEFLAVLAHELRNPLAAIRNAIHMLVAAKPNVTTIANAHGVLDRQTRNMMRMVDDLLDVSRVTHGKIQLHPKLLDLNAIVRSAVEASEHERHAASQQIAVAASPEPVMVFGDSARLEQVMHNLLLNASKFTGAKGHVTVRVECVPDTGKARVSVRDDGEGMDPALLAHVFELFAQGPSARDGRAGLGIGLTLARRLMEMHGGTIEASSAGPGQGSEFVVTLPLAGKEAPHSSLVPAAKARRHAAGKARKVMVVDDNLDAAESQVAVLQLANHEVRVAHDGEAGLRVASEFRPEVVLLDIAMPGLNGHEVAERLRADPKFKDVFLVALTGFGQPADIARSREAGFDEHLTKPVDPERLLALIASVPAKS